MAARSEEPAGQGGQCRDRDVVSLTDTPSGIGCGPSLEERGLPFLSEDSESFPESRSAVAPNGYKPLWHITHATARNQGFEEFMARIEIPNVYTFDMAINARGPKRFAVIGEPVVAVDLINTVAAPGSPTADDLLAADRDVQAW
jgi:hypothetical protein